MGRSLNGIAVGVGSSIAIGLVGIPIRTHIAVATGALILVIPVVAAVVVGGYVAGLVTAATGFLVYDLVFLPPYFTLDVRDGENWVALVVYAVVAALVARVVARLDEARQDARSREIYGRHLLDLSELLLSEHAPGDLAAAVTQKIATVFAIRSVSLVVERGGRLEVLATAGTPLASDAEGAGAADSAVPVAMSTRSSCGDPDRRAHRGRSTDRSAPPRRCTDRPRAARVASHPRQPAGARARRGGAPGPGGAG